jgi:hypothetical protein
MKQRLTLAALAAVGVLMLAVPSMASAGTWNIDPEPTHAAPLNFTTKGGEAKLTTTSSVVTCETNEGAGYYTTPTTGFITKLTFHGCHTTVFGFTINCKTAGEVGNTITATVPLEFHNIMIHSTAQVAGGRPGILITSAAEEHFAGFECGGNQITVTGNGVIGEISSPKCGGKSKTGTLKFESSATGVQKYQQITTEGTKYDLKSSTNGGAPVTASEDAEATITFEKEATVTCP